MISCLEAKDEMVREYDRRRKFVVNELRNIGLKCYVPKGAFYVFPDIRVSGLTSDQFAEKLLFEYKACVVPGNAFGDCGEGFVRISYAYSVDHIKEGISRIGEMLKSL